MHKAIIILCTFLMGLISCSEEDAQTVDLTLDSFVDHLTPEMSYQEIVKTLHFCFNSSLDKGGEMAHG